MDPSDEPRGSLARVVRSRLARESGWVIAGQMTSALVMLGGIRLVTEVVPSDVFGAASLVLGGVALVHGLLVRPLLQALLRYRPEATRGGWTDGLSRVLVRLFGRALGCAAALALATVLTWGLISSDSWPWPVAGAALLWLAANTVVSYWMSRFNADRRHARVAAIQVLNEVAKPLGAVTLVLLAGAALTPYVLGQGLLLAGLAAGCGVLALGGSEGASPLRSHATSRALLGRWWTGRPNAAERAPGQDPEGDRIRQRVLGYALPLLPLAGVNWGVHLGDRYLLELYQGSAAVGIYAAAYGLASGPFRQLGGTATMIFRPHLFEASGDDVTDAVEKRDVHARRWVLFVLAIGVPALLVLSMGREWFGRLLLAPEYRAGAELFPVIGAAYLLLALARVWEHRLLGRERSRAVLTGSIISLGVSLGGAVWLIPLFGLSGAAWATLAGSVVYLGADWGIYRWYRHSSHE